MTNPHTPAHGFSAWLSSFRERLRERARAVATFDDRGIACHWPDGDVESVTWEDLSSIEFQTTDAGPFVEDVFLVLHGHDCGCVVPQEAEGFDLLFERLQQLPGFNGEAVIAAMCSTEKAVFPCWRRAGL